MNPVRRQPRQRVVKTYGRDSLLIWANPLISAVQALLGLRVGLRSDAAVLADMQRDAEEMASRGYRIASAEELGLPLIAAAGQRATYYRVTYELNRADEP